MTTTEAVPEGPLFWTIVSGFTHVGRYKRQYGLVVVWALLMMLVPPWRGDVFGPMSPVASAPRRVPVVPENATVAALPISPLASSPSLSVMTDAGEGFESSGQLSFGSGGGAGSSGGASVAFQPPATNPDDDRSSEEDADTGGSLFTVPPPPPVPIPAAPKEIQPVLRAVSPIVRSGCSAVGLAGVVIAVAGPGLEPVPATQLAPYLVPAYAACATFPPFGARTVCALDDIYAVDTGGLIPSPAIIGMGIDVIEQMEKLAELAGGPPPGTAEQLRQQLDCRRD